MHIIMQATALAELRKMVRCEASVSAYCRTDAWFIGTSSVSSGVEGGNPQSMLPRATQRRLAMSNETGHVPSTQLVE